MFGFFKNRRRQQLLVEPLPADLVDVVRQNVAVFQLLAPDEQQRLLGVAKIIAAERPFYGVGHFEITDEVLVTIAAQAALLVLNSDGYYFDRVSAILVHESDLRIRLVHPLGGAELVEEGVGIGGQLLEQGEVRLVWEEVIEGGQDAADGYNVVLHEFAHHLDWLDGAVDGAPPLSSAVDRRRWLEVFDETVARHGAACRAGHETLLADHASDSTIELFAYSTECFFEQPHELAEVYPNLFQCLLGFYKTDPRRWFVTKDEG